MGRQDPPKHGGGEASSGQPAALGDDVWLQGADGGGSWFFCGPAGPWGHGALVLSEDLLD